MQHLPSKTSPAIKRQQGPKYFDRGCVNPAHAHAKLLLESTAWHCYGGGGTDLNDDDVLTSPSSACPGINDVEIWTDGCTAGLAGGSGSEKSFAKKLKMLILIEDGFPTLKWAASSLLSAR